jgi:hypothetical protein
MRLNQRIQVVVIAPKAFRAVVASLDDVSRDAGNEVALLPGHGGETTPAASG